MWKCSACGKEFKLSDELDPMEKMLLTQKICPECGAEAIVEYPSIEVLMADPEEWEDVPDEQVYR